MYVEEILNRLNTGIPLLNNYIYVGKNYTKADLIKDLEKLEKDIEAMIHP